MPVFQSPRKMEPFDPYQELKEEKPAPRVNVPKGISFDGKSDWQAFIIKFATYADREEWNSRTRRDVLSWVLEGQASKFYANLIRRSPDLDYFEVVNKLAKRFDIRDLPETTQILFSSAVQEPKESLVEWCDRIATLATEAFPDWTEEQINRQTVLRFCQGCSDKAAGFHVINTKPTSLEQAMDEIKRYQQSSMAIYGRPSKTCQVREEEEVEPSATRVPGSEGSLSHRQTPTSSKCLEVDDSLVRRVERLEKNMDRVLKSIRSLEETCRSLESKLTQIAVSQTRTPFGKDKSQGKCFGCGEVGHFRSECPQTSKVRQLDGDEAFHEDTE
jgi:hypothetical protein